MAVGSVGHKTLAFNNEQKIATGDDISVKDAKEHFAEEYDVYSTKNDIDTKGKTDDYPRATGISAIEKYMQINPNKHYRPVSCERTIEFDIPEVETKVTAVLDVEYKNSTINMLKDYKFSEKAPSVSTVFNSMQLKTYCMAYKSEGKRIPSVGFDYTVMTKEPKVICVAPQITNEMLESTYQDFVNVIQQIKYAMFSGTFYRNSTSFSCTPDGCGYYNKCKPDEKKLYIQLDDEMDEFRTKKKY